MKAVISEKKTLGMDSRCKMNKYPRRMLKQIYPLTRSDQKSADLLHDLGVNQYRDIKKE